MMVDNSTRLKIGVLFGGRSGEHEVSLNSARSVLKALDSHKYEVIQIGITREGTWLVGENLLAHMMANDHGEELKKMTAVTILPDPTQKGLYAIHSAPNPVLEHLIDLDVVFPVLHGTFGEDGTLQGLLDMAGLAYVGAGVLGSAAGMDKGLFKDVMRANDIPILDWMLILRSELEHDSEMVMMRIEKQLPYPVFIKPANLGSSVGITKCKNRADLVEGLFEAVQYDRRLVVEKGIKAREIEISVLGNDDPRVSVPGEVIPSREFYSYESKYIDNTSNLIIPAPLPKETTRWIQDLAVRAYKAIDCAGMARVDFLLAKDAPIHQQQEGLYLNELNTIPGFTNISMYSKLWEASGLPYPELVDRLIDLAIERRKVREATRHEYQRVD